MWAYFHPDIQLIEATPKSSPLPKNPDYQTIDENIPLQNGQSSQSRKCHQKMPDEEKLRMETSKIDARNFLSNRRAPLASISSFKISSVDYQDSDLRSLGSDSVFVESYADTDDDCNEQFSTDTDEINDTQISTIRLHRPTKKQSVIFHSKVRADIELMPRGFEDDTTIVSNESKEDVTIDGNAIDTKESSLVYFPSMDNGRIWETELSKEKPSKRPASYSGAPTNTVTLYQCSNLDNNNVNDNDVSRSIHLSNSNRNSKSTSNMIDELLQQKHTFFSQQDNGHKQQSNSICSRRITRQADDINVDIEIDVDNSKNQLMVNRPSTVLELSTHDQPLDPSLPGPSRKWSRETLF